MKQHLVEITFDVPISDILVKDIIDTINWVRLDSRTIVMLKNEWLDKRSDLQPHKAKDIYYD